MFYYFSKALSMFLNPLGWVFLLWLVLILIKSKRNRKIVISSQIFILWIFSTGAFTEWASRLYEIHPTDIKKMKAAEIGVVLTGGLANDPESGRNGSYIGNEADRMWQAVRLFKAGKIHKILISGGDNSKKVLKIENEVAKQFLLDFGIPDTCIIQETISRNTYENAVNTAQILKEKYRNPSIILITSAYHMPRALACFKKQNLSPAVFASSPICTFWEITFKDFVPDPEELFKSKLLIKEWIGHLVYKCMGYV